MLQHPHPPKKQQTKLKKQTKQNKNEKQQQTHLFTVNRDITFDSLTIAFHQFQLKNAVKRKHSEQALYIQCHTLFLSTHPVEYPSMLQITSASLVSNCLSHTPPQVPE